MDEGSEVNEDAEARGASAGDRCRCPVLSCDEVEWKVQEGAGGHSTAPPPLLCTFAEGQQQRRRPRAWAEVTL